MKTDASKYALTYKQYYTPHKTFTRPTGETVRGFAAERLDQIVALKGRIVADLERQFAGVIGAAFIRQIVTEAEGLAATTPFPALLLPGLAEERAHNAAIWSVRQRTIRNQTFNLTAA